MARLDRGLIRRACLLVLIGGGCGDAHTAPGSATATATATRAPRGKPIWHTAAGLRVLEVELGEHDGLLPMVVFVHGRGGVAQADWIEGLQTHARYLFPQAPLPFGHGYSWFTYSADREPALLAHDIGAMTEQLSAALAELTRSRPTRGKVVITGFSQGAMLSYALALAHPEQLALAIPMSGMLPEPLYQDAPRAGVRYAPIRALHGTADELVPYAADERMVSSLRAKGLDIELSSYDGVKHRMTPPMFEQMHELVAAAVAAQAQ